MAKTATLSANFRIAVPKDICAALDWKAGQEFAFIRKGAGVLLVPVPEAEELRGIVRGASAEQYRDRGDRF